MTEPRAIVRSFLSQEQSEGNGARVRRSIGRPELRRLDPFLMVRGRDDTELRRSPLEPRYACRTFIGRR
jgi:redox-sensitive bicupin YhaK (pirin superfamily)